MKKSRLKSIIIILGVFVCGEVFSYDWKGRMEIFSYDLANRYENEYFYVLEEYYETFKYRDRNYLTSVMPNFVNTGFWETAFDRYFEWYEIIRIEELGIGIDKNEELLVFTGPYFVIENVEEMTSELLKIETKIPEYSRQFLKVGALDWNFISDTSDECIFYLEFDGDYINVYANDIDKKFCTFCKMYEEDIALLRECIKTNVWNDITVTWPRHADGTCDYEDEGGNATAISDFTQVEHYSEGILENDFYRNENLQYVTAESTKVYSNDWELVGTEKKNKIMENCSLTITLDHYVMIGKDNHWMNADDLYIRGSSLLPEEIVYDQIHPEYEWIPVWYNEVIKCQGVDFKKAVYKYAPFLEGKWLPDSECWWYEDVTFSYPCVFRFQNTYLCLTTDGWGVQKFLIERIIERNKSYYIHCKSIGFYYDEYKDNLCYFENFPRVNHGETFVLRLEQNGGHLFLYNDGTNKLIEELMPASRAWIKKLQEYFNTGINTFTPKDVSLLSRKTDAPTTADALIAAAEESAIQKPAPAVGKTAAVTENLRLRTDDRTTAEVVATLAAGTLVKILAVGREDAIDGIASNWMRVAVLGGARDRDGNAVAAGTEGWLFGGYLSAAEDAESDSPNGKAAAAKAPALPIALVAAGGAVLAALLVAILLTVRKRKGGRSVIVKEHDGNA